MAVRTVKVSARFARRVQEVAEWYATEVDTLAARHFLDDLDASMNAVCAFPAIGTPDEKFSTPRCNYLSFAIHQRYRIVYRYTSRTVYFTALRATLMG